MTKRKLRPARTTLIVFALCTGACLVPRAAHGQQPTAAEALFREGRQLLARGDIDGACGRFAESQRLEPAGGTLMNLADCRQRQGKTASAWAGFSAAEELSKQQGRTARASEAARRAAALIPALSRLTILVPQAVPGLEVRRDDELVESHRIGVAVPVDPGPHRITASAPGYVPVSVEIALGAKADSQTVTLPELQPQSIANEQPATPTPPTSPTAAPPVWTPPAGPEPMPADRALREQTTSHTAGWVIGGSGIALAGLGGAFYLMSLSANQQAESQCRVQARYSCNGTALDAEERRDTYATLATIGGVAGLAGIGVGAWLILTAPPDESQPRVPSARARPRLIPAIAPNHAGLIFHAALP